MDSNRLKGHASMAGAEFLWGASAPLGKMILAGGVSPLMLTDFRMVGAALLFWVVSVFMPSEKVSRRDLISLFFAAMLGIVINQSCFIWGLSLTSPINASIITTSLPIVTMVLAALVLREPITGLKAGGVFLGALGAIILISGSRAGTGGSSPVGDALVLTAQISFSCYLVLFKGLIGKYTPITLMKWMFTFASIVVLPSTYSEWSSFSISSVSPSALAGVAAFVVGPTFLSYLLLPVGQRNLRPTVTAMYNYVQPVVASIIAMIAGMGRFTLANGAAIVLVFTGVFLVTKSKSRADMEKDTRK